MILVPFDDWKDGCGLEATDCKHCDGDGCTYSGSFGDAYVYDCTWCDEGLIEPDYTGEYLRHLRDTMKKLVHCMAVTISQKRSVIISIKSDSRLSKRYLEMRREHKEDEK